MKMFAINEARKPPRIGSIAIMSGTLLCAVATSGPVFSADLPYDYGRPRYTEYSQPSYDRPSYDRDCCCCVRRYAPVADRPMVERVPPPIIERAEEESRQGQMIERVPVAERHWVQRDYIERRYPAPGPRDSSPKAYRYSYYYPKSSEEERYYRDESRSEPRPPRYSGEYLPAPAAYEYDAPPPRYAAPPRIRELRPAYEYEPSPRPAYEYGPPRRSAYERELAPRPPAPVPSGYYHHPGYAE
jgi:hypothetical protein